MRVLLLSTYELGHQPLHLASPAGTLRRAGHEVRCVDLAVDRLESSDLEWCDLVGVSVPMHTATRLAAAVTAELRMRRPGVPVCFYGLYAGAGAGEAGASEPEFRIAGEYESELQSLADALDAGRLPPWAGGLRVSLGRQHLGLPARDLLAPPARYARLVAGGETRLAGYVEASRGCVHRCRHCPVPVVYDGRTRVAAVDAVVADVAQLVEHGVRHVSFGDPDFLSGPAHARRVVAAVHHHFPSLTFDVTVKVSHVLAHQHLWPQMAEAGCLFVVSAFESASDVVLEKLAKGHTADDEVEAVAVLRRAGIEPRPSLLPFTPWTTADDVRALVDLVEHCQLVGNVDPVQWSIRLLVPPGSLLLEDGALDGLLGPYDPAQLGYPWRSPDARLDELQRRLAALAEEAGAASWGAEAAHLEVRRCVEDVLGPWGRHRAFAPDPRLASPLGPDDRPRLSEAWFCCAEPTSDQWQLSGAGRP
jgi:radical SAM superfamily enzyme YgiQ (UPF0313 family)